MTKKEIKTLVLLIVLIILLGLFLSSCKKESECIECMHIYEIGDIFPGIYTPVDTVYLIYCDDYTPFEGRQRVYNDTLTHIIHPLGNLYKRTICK